jgi:hypothetical protein
MPSFIKRIRTPIWAAALVLGLLSPSLLQAQAPNPPDANAEKQEHAPPVGGYALAALSTILVMLMICAPSRKS